MSDFVVVESDTGRCVQVHRSLQACSTDHLRTGQVLYEVPEGFDDSAFYFVGTDPVAFPPQPSTHHQWDWATKQWADPRTPEQVTAALQTQITKDTQAHLDAFARTRGYDSMLSACTYATSTVPAFAVEGQHCVTLRDTTWTALFAIFAQVQAGTRAMPTLFSEVVGELPVLVWDAS